MMCPVPHRNKDTSDEPSASRMKEIILEAAHTAAQNHTFSASRGVTKGVVQNSMTFHVFTEV